MDIHFTDKIVENKLFALTDQLKVQWRPLFRALGAFASQLNDITFYKAEAAELRGD